MIRPFKTFVRALGQAVVGLALDMAYAIPAHWGTGWAWHAGQLCAFDVDRCGLAGTERRGPHRYCARHALELDLG